jgi:two-component system, repressor protein LuxO
LEDVIRETVEAAIDNCDGSIPRAAAALDVSPSTLYRRIEGWRADAAA